MASDNTVDVLQKIADRNRFLNKIYDHSGGRANVLVYTTNICRALGLNNRQAWDIIEFLRNDKLITYRNGGYAVALSHDGLKQIESLRVKQDSAIESLAPINFVSIGSMNNSVLQQGNINSSQNVNHTVQPELKEELKVLLSDLKKELANLSLEEDSRREVSTDIATVEAQLDSPKPKVSILKEALSSIRVVLEGAFAAGLSPDAQTFIDRIARFISAIVSV